MFNRNFFLDTMKELIFSKVLKTYADHYRYVPAYSTRLKFESGIWTVLPPNSSDPMGMLDPVWTESNWNAIGLRVYTVQDAAYDHIVLVAGISVTFLAYLATVTTRAVLTKALKRD